MGKAWHRILRNLTKPKTRRLLLRKLSNSKGLFIGLAVGFVIASGFYGLNRYNSYNSAHKIGTTTPQTTVGQINGSQQPEANRTSNNSSPNTNGPSNPIPKTSTSNQQTQQTTPQPSPTPTPTPTPPQTLSNCVFANGPLSGSNCPAATPPSWSYSKPCYANGGGAQCPPYTQTGWITADYVNGVSYCEFDFRGEGNPTGAQYLRVKVTNYNHPGSLPDCSVEHSQE
ncbi:MAG TPA: hypothetical protein VLF90_04380 [Patescibacteria group bacterium]|nr:hypothetical protein [Patescibacteria group bacterium]